MQEDQLSPKPKSHKRLKSLVTLLVESVLTILLVLSFFSIFLYLLNALFPTGVSLKSLMDQRNAQGYSTRTTPGSQAIEHGEVVTSSWQELAAIVTRTRNSVKSKRAEAIVWMSADVGKHLFDRDAVQTLDRSAADITFDEHSILNMGENSLLIIKKQIQDPLFREKRSFMVLVDGDLRGRINGSNPNSVHLEIGTPAATINTKGGAATKKELDFKISVNPDKSSTIAVYSGSAEVAANGKKVIVKENQATVVAMGQVPLKPRTIPTVVTLRVPSKGRTYPYRDLPPHIRFHWKDQAAATGYHFLLARDPEFREIVTEDTFEGNKFKHGNLVEGTYYWKVSARNDSIEGFFSEVRQFRVLRDNTPPSLDVRFPPNTVYGGEFLMEGKTEPNATVYIGGRRVDISSTGTFTHPLDLLPGMNVIVVEAFDTVNNVAYCSKRVVSK